MFISGTLKTFSIDGSSIRMISEATIKMHPMTFLVEKLNFHPYFTCVLSNDLSKNLVKSLSYL